MTTTITNDATREYFRIFDLFLIHFLSFDGEFYQPFGSSTYSHTETWRIANYRCKALTTGCDDQNSDCDIKTELMDMNTLSWSSGPDYPFTDR